VIYVAGVLGEAPALFFKKNTFPHMNPNLPVAGIMTRQVVTIQPDMSISHVHDIFEKNTFHHLLVQEHGKIVGVISKSDYYQIRYMLSISWGGEVRVLEWFADLCVRDIMTKNPVCIESSDTIGLAADIFMVNRFHCLPVVDDGELAGVITSHDLLAYAYKNPISEEEQLETITGNADLE
jgi:CBS domain-containing protein